MRSKSTQLSYTAQKTKPCSGKSTVSGEEVVYKTKTPFGEIFIGYITKDGESFGDISSVSTPWGDGVAALYFGDYRRTAVFSYSTANIGEGCQQLPVDLVANEITEKKTGLLSLNDVLRRVEDIYVATIEAEHIAVSEGFKKLSVPLSLPGTLSIGDFVFVETSGGSGLEE